MYRLTTLSFAALMTTACMASPMDHGNGEMRSAVADAKQEALSHGERCQSATTLADVMEERDRHGQAMGSILGHMDGAMDDMHGMSCSGAGMDGMRQTVSDLKSAMKPHHAALGAVADVPAAHSECARYTDQMTELCASADQESRHLSCM